MNRSESLEAVRLAVSQFLLTLSLVALIGILVFGDPPAEAISNGLTIGVAVAIGYYFYSRLVG